MHQDRQAFILFRRLEIARDEIELLSTGRECMTSLSIAPSHPHLAGLIRKFEVMKNRARSGAVRYRAHPASDAPCVRRVIQHNGETTAQKIDHMRPHGPAKTGRIADIVLNSPYFRAEQPIEPNILADKHRAWRSGEVTGESRFTGGDLAAKQMQYGGHGALPFPGPEPGCGCDPRVLEQGLR